MASRRGMTIRNEQAEARIDAAMAQFAELGAFEVESQPVYRRDAARQETERLERVADILERAVGVLTNVAAERDAALNAVSQKEAPDFTKMKRAELEASAAGIGIENPGDKEAFPNVDALIGAIETKSEAE
jgi:hypothetical protein